MERQMHWDLEKDLRTDSQSGKPMARLREKQMQMGLSKD
jgi:hypothetical protein